MLTRLQIRRSNSLDWNNSNPVLLQGELGLELDTNLLKAGDGFTNWLNLPYLNPPQITQQEFTENTTIVNGVGTGIIPVSRGIIYEVICPPQTIFHLYNSQSALEADNRPITQDPDSASGVLLDLYTDQEITKLSPVVVAVAVGDDQMLHYKILSSEASISLTIKFIKL